MNRATISHNRIRREQRTGWLIHKRHKLIGKSRHGATDTDTADIRATTNTGHPTALAYITLYYRSPTPQSDNALPITISFSKLTLLIIATTITTFMQSVAKKPGWPER